MDHLDLDALVRFRDQGIGKQIALIIAVDDVAFEKYAVRGRSDSVEPGGVILGCVNKQADVIPGNKLGARYALEGLIDKVSIDHRQADRRCRPLCRFRGHRSKGDAA